MLKITVLGTGSIIPTAGRRATAAMVETLEENILFDCGPSVPGAAAESGYGISSIDRIFLTHYHPDHTLGIGHILAAVKNDPDFPPDESIPLYGPPGLEEFIESWPGVYNSLETVIPLFELFEVSGDDIISCRDSEVSVLDAVHGSAPAVSYKIESDDYVFVYTGDTGLTEELVDFCKGADLIAAECSFPDEDGMKGHMTVSDVGRLATEAEPEKIVLVHMYPQVNGEEARNKISQMCRAEVVTGKDGLIVI
ncbi:MAG: MBL fold metallo-hydrolase [Candidatus Krumholzibacteriota bacterium]